MARDRIGSQIETLIRKGEWKQAQTVIEKQLDKVPEDHWLWGRLSGVKYEQRDYRGALKAAQRAREFVPDCPLANWSFANASEMLGKIDGAIRQYAQLIDRGLKQLQHPDEDASECWEGADWTSGLVADCVFRIAGCLAKRGQRDKAVGTYRYFLSLADLGIQSIYSHQDALEKLNKLVPNKKVRREAAVKVIEETEEFIEIAFSAG
jgi:tetratricopeptide (TPR) repeat protein